MAINRLAGTGTITAVTLAALRTFTLDLSDALSVSKVTVNGRRPEQFRCSAGKLHVTLGSTLPAGARDDRRGPLRRQRPVPLRTLWGEVGFEELSNGALVAGQPNGAASWFPCDDHPAGQGQLPHPDQQPTARITHWPTANCCPKQVRASHTIWVYEQAPAHLDLPDHPADR